jgi:hypothetical protein
MEDFTKKILALQANNATLFYNTSGSKHAYQLGIKHLSAAEFLGFALILPDDQVLIRKACYLVDLEKQAIQKLSKNMRLFLIPLAH